MTDVSAFELMNVGKTRFFGINGYGHVEYRGCTDNETPVELIGVLETPRDLNAVASYMIKVAQVLLDKKAVAEIRMEQERQKAEKPSLLKRAKNAIKRSKNKASK